ncbi:MAG: hypothetical protein HUU20_07625 [Pirellulales bacterium]|nr:hypothetical protein [Pirellulales bacterium]
MKPTARTLTGLIAIALVFSVAVAWAQAPAGYPASQGTTGAGRPAGASEDQARRLCDDLLQRARQAMAENDLAAAGSLISQAESLGVEYSPLYFGDTPKKARKDLERKLPSAGRMSAAGSQPADPFAARTGSPGASAPADPKALAKSYILNARKEMVQGNLPGAMQWHRKAAEQRAVFGPDEDSPERLAADIRRMSGQPAVPGVTPLPPTDQVTQIPPASSQGNFAVQPAPAAQDMGGDRATAGQLLLEARRALAMGDVRRAGGMVEQARSLNVRFSPADDTPDRVEAQITAYRNLKAEEPQRGNTEAYRRQFARILMEQAEGLLRWRELDEAERLATEAARQPVTYSPFESKPQDLLGRIAAARSQGRSATTLPEPASGAMAAKQRVADLLRQARLALGSGDLRRADELTRQAAAVGVPDSAFTMGEDRPMLVLQDIERVRIGGPAGMMTGGQQVTAATGSPDFDRRATRALYDQRNDATRNTLANSQEPIPAGGVPTAVQAVPGMPPGAVPQPSVGMALFQQGETALRNHDPQTALQHFRQAATYINELDPVTAQRLQDHLQIMSQPASPSPSIADEAGAKQQILARQVNADVAIREGNARKLMEKDPKAALALLEETRQKVDTAGLEPAAKEQLLRRVDRTMTDVRKYIDANRPRIELEEKNRQVVQDIATEQQQTLDNQEKLARMVDEYNDLMREQRFAEAEVVAKRAAELDPKNPLSQQLVITAKLIRRHMNNLSVGDAKERGFTETIANVDQASIPFNDAIPLVFPDAKQWQDLTARRERWAKDGGRNRTERELEIEQKLKTPVSLQFQNAPLATVLDYLAKLAEVNLYIDPQGLAEEGVTTDTPVSIDLRQEIKLESALNLILQPLHLSYVIKDEVLKVTSEQLRDGEVYTKTYTVADLVIPIPNFAPSPRMGLAGAYGDAMGNAGFGQNGPFGAGSGAPLSVAANQNGAGATINPAVMAQMSGGTPNGMPTNMPIGPGPGGLGGGAMADFDSLIELITTTIAPTTWDEVGGPGSIAPFETNLSLVISQTQEVHEEIADLLEQLRRMQDLQVTIEVRFITLNDNFFERIGVDFDFDIDDDIDRPFQVWGRPDPGGTDDDDTTDQYISPPFPRTVAVAREIQDRDHDKNITVGMSSPDLFSADLDIPFRQNSFGLAVPQFGGFDATAGASLGFAILSDIEAFFFIEAAQGDRRTNILQAPKVTLFNGQQAHIVNMNQQSYISDYDVVQGQYDPIISILSYGTVLDVQAIASADKKYITLTMRPTNAQIQAWRRFGPPVASFPGGPVVQSGTAIAASTAGSYPLLIPQLSYNAVRTSVTIPDGGSLVIAGMTNGDSRRSHAGVPFLSHIPFLGRLFSSNGRTEAELRQLIIVQADLLLFDEIEAKL